MEHLLLGETKQTDKTVRTGGVTPRHPAKERRLTSKQVVEAGTQFGHKPQPHCWDPQWGGNSKPRASL